MHMLTLKLDANERYGAVCCAVVCRGGTLTDEVYGQEIMFVANDWHAALLPLLLTARFRLEPCLCCAGYRSAQTSMRF